MDDFFTTYLMKSAQHYFRVYVPCVYWSNTVVRFSMSIPFTEAIMKPSKPGHTKTQNVFVIYLRNFRLGSYWHVPHELWAINLNERRIASCALHLKVWLLRLCTHTHALKHTYAHTHTLTYYTHASPRQWRASTQRRFLSLRGSALHPSWAHRCLPHRCVLGNVRPRRQNGLGCQPPCILCGFLTFNSHSTMLYW